MGQNNDTRNVNKTRNIGLNLRIYQINVESISCAKSEYLSKQLELENIDIALVQETHSSTLEDLQKRGSIPGYELVVAEFSPSHGIATYRKKDLNDVNVIESTTAENIYSSVISVGSITVTNVYKAPTAKWSQPVLKMFPHPAVYAGDFNSHHNEWGYQANDENGESIMTWASAGELHLVHDAKDRGTFYSRAHRREYNPDLCFVSTDQEGWPLNVTKKVLPIFPNSQHRPIIIEVGMSIPIISSIPRPRWNFQKADWKKFQTKVDSAVRFIPPEAINYDRFTNLIITTAKKCVPRGYRKEYIPCWSEDSDRLYNELQETEDTETAKELLKSLDTARRERWTQTVENIDMKRSSRKGWALIRKLGGASKLIRNKPKMSANRIARKLVQTSKAPYDKNFLSRITKKYRDARKTTPKSAVISRAFSVIEVNEAVNAIKNGKASGFDSIYPEFIKNSGPRCKLWLARFFSNVLRTNTLPRAFKVVKIISLLKPNKDENKPENYRPISLLSVTLKLMERMLYNRMEPEIEKLLPSEQAGFRKGRSCNEQVLSLTNYIESGYQKQLKTGVVFIDLSAAYDTVWKRGLMFKLIKAIPCLELCDLICNMLSDRLFQVFLNDQKSGTRKLNNGLPQGSVLSCLLFNLYVHDLPPSMSRKFLYADDKAFAFQHKNFNEINNTLNKDMRDFVKYCKNWRLIPNTTKTVASCFHLNNHAASLELRIWFDGACLKHDFEPVYLGIKLDRSLTFNQHTKNVASKLSTRNNLLRKLAGTSWGASASCLKTTALAIVFSTAEYCCSSWINSAHVKNIDTELNKTMRITTGTVNSTPIPWLYALGDIAPPDKRRQQILLREYRKAMSNPNIPLHHDLSVQSTNRLKSRKPPIATAKLLHESDFNIKDSWKVAWAETGIESPLFDFDNHTSASEEFLLTRKVWCNLNRIRTGHGRCNDMLFKWRMVNDPSCDCGEPYQTTKHILSECPIWSYSGSIEDFKTLDGEALEWLRTLNL